jgi:aspartate aminotransferase
MQYAALAAVDASPTANARSMNRRLEVISNKLREMSLPFKSPDGGMYLYPKLRDGLNDARVVNKALDLGVAVAPGSGFGGCYSQFIRISACQHTDLLLKGLDLLQKAIDS